MAPANTPGRKKRDNQANYFKVGVQGRLVMRFVTSSIHSYLIYRELFVILMILLIQENWGHFERYGGPR